MKGVRHGTREVTREDRAGGWVLDVPGDELRLRLDGAGNVIALKTFMPSSPFKENIGSVATGVASGAQKLQTKKL